MKNHASIAKDPKQLDQQLRDIAIDLAHLKAVIEALQAQLDADAGVTDTDYASGNAVTITVTNP